MRTPSSQSTKKTPSVPRRDFLKTTAAASTAFALPMIVPARALGLEGTAASERVTMGFIGTGGKGRHNMEQFLGFEDCQVVAVCDVDSRHLAEAKKLSDKSGDWKSTGDFRELCENKDIEAMCVSTPDHWHALATIAALDGGKDVYCEKPLANSVAEGRAMCRAAMRNNKLIQTGSHERSVNKRRHACELVRNGRIGKLHTIRINLPMGDPHHRDVLKWTHDQPAMDIPKELDWDMWLGHTKPVDYTEKRCHFWWRFITAHGGGEMTDRGAHVIDLAQLGAGRDDTGPVEFIAKGSKNTSGIFDAFMDYVFINIYKDGLKMIGSTKGPRGVKFEGTEGWIFIHVHDNKVEASNPAVLESKLAAGDTFLGRSPGHHRNFADCVRSREAPMAHAEIGHRTATVCHLNNIAMTVGRPITWDPVQEKIVGDDEAQR
ncbi:MAG: Gfo/Idh/MocA family oxidoreductase, partial [Planctomycetota bacterium]